VIIKRSDKMLDYNVPYESYTRKIAMFDDKSKLIVYPQSLSDFVVEEFEKRFPDYRRLAIETFTYSQLAMYNYRVTGLVQLTHMGISYPLEYLTFENDRYAGYLLENNSPVLFNKEDFEFIFSPLLTANEYLLFPTWLLVNEELDRDLHFGIKLSFDNIALYATAHEKLGNKRWYESVDEFQNLKVEFTGLLPINVEVAITNGWELNFFFRIF